MTRSPLLREACYIDGEWVKADSGETINVTNPATGEVLGTVPNCGAAETRRAVEAANRAWPAWRAKTAKERAVILRRWYELIMANQDELARLLTLEQGKSLAEARGEIAYGAAFIEWYAEEGKRLYGDVIPGHMADKRIVVLKQPIGVAAAITPWNFPNAMITRKAGPALAAGCPIVLKPAAETPYSAIALAVLAEEAGLPKGIFNVLTGKASAIGGELTSNPIVRKLSFTGSTEIGRLLMRQSAETIKKLSLELGGNAPFIVFDDADVDAAVVGAMASKYRNSGQTCVCSNRLYVQAGVYDEFVEKLAAAAAKLKVGSGLEDGTEQGPLINMAGSRRSSSISPRPRARARRSSRAASATRSAARSLSRLCSRTSRRTCSSRTRKLSGRSPPSSASKPTRTPSRWRTTASLASLPTSIRTTSPASGAWRRRSSRAWSASTRASSPRRSHPSAASSSPASAAKARATASMSMSR